jgi:ferredoxin
MMAKIKVTDKSGVVREIEAPGDGRPLMRLLMDHGFDVGLCGGNCSCGTCVGRFQLEWHQRFSPADQVEKELLSVADDPGSLRLTCMIPFTEELDGVEFVLVPLE